MGDVISMTDFKGAPVTPKIEGRMYKGHRYILTYNPNAPVTQRWGWVLKYTRTYEFSGREPTIEKAAKAAQTKVDVMEGRSDSVSA